MQQQAQHMRIAFIVDMFPALSETFVLNQITGLLDLGHSVEIFALAQDREAKQHADVLKYDLSSRTHYSDMPRNKVFRALKALGYLLTNWGTFPKLINSLNGCRYGRVALSFNLFYRALSFLRHAEFDIIHCHFGHNGTVGAHLKDAGIVRGKLIVSFHGFDVNLHSIRHKCDIYRALFNQAQVCTVETDYTASRLQSLGCPKQLIRKHPVGLDVANHQFQEKVLRPGQRIEILSIARFVEKKGLEYSIRAVAKVRQRHPNLRYRIAGDGPLRDSLLAIIDGLQAHDIIELLGPVTQLEVLQLYRDSHIFILPSVTAASGDQEGQGLVLQEAQASGLPVLSTLHNGIPEGVLDRKSGFLVPERDVDALVDKLSFLLEHPDVWAKIGRAGRTFVETQFDICKLNQQLVALYESLIGSEGILGKE